MDVVHVLVDVSCVLVELSLVLVKAYRYILKLSLVLVVVSTVESVHFVYVSSQAVVLLAEHGLICKPVDG